MGRIAGTTFIKVDGQQLSVTGGVEVPMNTKLNADVIGLDGSIDRKETHRAPYIKGTYKVPADFPIQKLLDSAEQMTITTELATGKVYVLVNAWVHDEANHNVEEGTADIEFHGQEGFYQ